MPYLKSRQYALLHLKQMKEVAQKLYDLAVTILRIVTSLSSQKNLVLMNAVWYKL